MKRNIHKTGKSSLTGGTILVVLFLLVSMGCQKSRDLPATQDELARRHEHPQSLKHFEQVNLVGNNSEYGAARVDPNFVNGWGIAFAPSGPIWINTEATGLSFVFNRNGDQLIPPVAIPSPTMPTGGSPTGIVFNGSSDFVLSTNGRPARFIFVGTDGVLSGWNGGANAVRIKDNSSWAVYTGLAIGVSHDANFLYAANFKTGKIDVFDKNFSMVTNKPFKDPFLPQGYAPFNIQNINNQLFVAYAKVGPEGDEENGPGHGFVDVFNTSGYLLARLASRGTLNSPWGLVMAPPNFFGADDMDEGDNDKHELHQNTILVGNFGDGRINVFSLRGHFLGQLRSHGKPLSIEGLWALAFSPNVPGSDPGQLFFAAGPEGEADGLFGYIKKQVKNDDKD